MTLAYAIIATEVAKEREVYKKLIMLDDIVEAYGCFGNYDIIVKLNGKDFDDIGKIVTEKIQAIPNIIDTKTLVVDGSKNIPSYRK